MASSIKDVMPTRLKQLIQLITPTRDGDLISKSDRDLLVNTGWADRALGWNIITPHGIGILVNLGILKQ